MLMQLYSSAVSSDDEEEQEQFSDEETEQFRANHFGLRQGKRKFISRTNDDSQHMLAISKLENLDLEDSDDEDVLLLNDLNGTHELLASDQDEPDRPKIVSKPVTKMDDVKLIVRHVKNDIHNGARSPDSSNVENCQMKWLRTVGMDHTGKLRCVVSGALVDTASDSGRSGKTESVMADTIRGMIDVYLKRRPDVITESGFIATPLHIVKQLAKDHDETLHCEAVSFPQGYHRVELFSGTIRGVGEGVTKRIAAQMAAIDMIERIQLSGGTVKVPPTAFLPGWLTSNRVFMDLREYCRMYNLPAPRLTSAANVNEDGLVDVNLPRFRAQCWVGEEYATVGESEIDIFARREAAKEMILLITNEEYKDTPYAIGTACKTVNELASAGFQMIMSDYKKMWLRKNRVIDNKLMIPENERGRDEPLDVEELERDIASMDDATCLDMMKQQAIKVCVNKKLKVENVDNSKTIVRRISVQDPILEDDEDESDF